MSHVKQPTVAAPPTVCECEHVDHFEGAVGAHSYGVKVFGSLTTMRTAYGRFEMCDACWLDGHLSLL